LQKSTRILVVVFKYSKRNLIFDDINYCDGVGKLSAHANIAIENLKKREEMHIKEILMGFQSKTYLRNNSQFIKTK